ncbi:glycolipid sulfotransferase [Mycobacterium ulcerans str. Harvey]|uniref:Glycolipid sulfotransferase n=1 Tax=Mycobacterium ulcerans str. Harvey TaxID=1299332 RepID=A0ABN0R132_MYCUL|nr:glycolipid sulfotransferase [Mycobacterium ulcerans str. Harvey]
MISAPSKCGVTLTQRLVSLLVFDGPQLPGPLAEVSPWLDRTVRPVNEVVAALNAQGHRRFIKTHTPLDGLVLDDRVTYIGVGRDPRDAAMSELFQWDNMNHANLNRRGPPPAIDRMIPRPSRPSGPGWKGRSCPGRPGCTPTFGDRAAPGPDSRLRTGDRARCRPWPNTWARCPTSCITSTRSGRDVSCPTCRCSITPTTAPTSWVS